jgi:hypothetical protein
VRLKPAFPRGLFRPASALTAAAACLTLAACTSPGSAPAAAQQARPVAGGTVTVKQGNKVICIMTVSNGKGTCQVPATSFGVGTSQIYASYSDKGKNGAQSRPVSVTVAQAGTTTTLSVTPPKVTYGNEQASHLAVTVAGLHGGTPSGMVKVTSGGITACVIKLSPAKGGATGSCALAAKALAIGARPLTATYLGDHWYGISASPGQMLTVVK